MNPGYETFLKDFKQLADVAKDLPLPEMRAASTRFLAKGVYKEPIFKVENRSIPGENGAEVPIRCFIPSQEAALPVLLFFHGGGWSFGCIDEIDPLCRRIANLSQIMVIAVDYCLAPENKFPKALEDCYAALKWVHEKGAEIGADPSRIAVGGESAGANLAAALCLLSRDKNESLASFQLLLYPAVTDDMKLKDFSLDGSFITKDLVQLYLNFYINTPEEGSSPYVSPLKASDLSGLPPAFIVAAEFDPLSPEAEAYAKRLSEFQVPAKFKRYRGAIHNFLSLPLPDTSDRLEALRDIRNELDAWKKQ